MMSTSCPGSCRLRSFVILLSLGLDSSCFGNLTVWLLPPFLWESTRSFTGSTNTNYTVVAALEWHPGHTCHTYDIHMYLIWYTTACWNSYSEEDMCKCSFFETFLVIRCCIRCVYQIWSLVTMWKCLLLWILPKATQTGHTNGKHLEREFSMEHLDASMRPVSGSGAKHIAAVKRQTEQQVCISLQEAVCLCPFRCRIFPKTCRFPWMLNNRAFRCWIEVRATNANSF